MTISPALQAERQTLLDEAGITHAQDLAVLTSLGIEACRAWMRGSENCNNSTTTIIPEKLREVIAAKAALEAAKERWRLVHFRPRSNFPDGKCPACHQPFGTERIGAEDGGSYIHASHDGQLKRQPVFS